MVALVVPDPDRGGIPLDPSQYRPLRRPARKSHCSDLPCRWRCHEVKVGSLRYLVRARPEPPSAPCLRRGRLRHLPPRSGGRWEMEITRRSPRGERFPIPFPTSPPEGEMPRRGRGGGTAVSRSCAQASPSVAARQLPLGGSDFRSPSQLRPLRGRCPIGAEGETAPHRHYSRSCEPPPQSLRDSSPSGGAMGSRIPLTALSGRRNPEGTQSQEAPLHGRTAIVVLWSYAAHIQTLFRGFLAFGAGTRSGG